MGTLLSLTPLDQLWVLVAAAMVFTMQAGFLCVEAGMSRAKHSMNVAIKNLTDYLAASIAFFLIGYGLMFGKSWLGILGTSDFISPFAASSSEAVFFFFQVVFCGTSATIVSGAMAERMTFKSYLVYSFFVSAFLYPLFGHWVWGGSFYLDQKGWLAQLGYLDFAGSSVVHQMGGWIALAGIIVLGPRLGKFDAQGRPRRLIGHDIPLALLGIFILWFGWFGFNGGSTLEMNESVGLVVVNTNLGGAAGALSALAVGWSFRKRADIFDIANGALGGLVAITASALYVTPLAAILIGAVAGPVIIVGGAWLENRLKLDDVVGAVPVHGFCGLWGILAVALFAKPEFLIHPENRFYHLGIQELGSISCFVVSFGGAFAFFKLLDRFLGLRVSPEAERLGLNWSEHKAKSSLQELAETVRGIAADRNWEKRVDVDPYSDTGEFGQHFNHLLDVVRESVREIDTKRMELEKQKENLEMINRNLKKAEEDLQSEHAQLLQADKMGAIGQLASGVAHEVRNPLGIILQGIASISRSRSLTVNDRRLLAMVEEAVGRANRIVQGLLKFSRRAPLKLVEGSLNKVILNSLILVEKHLLLRKVAVVKDLQGDLPSVMIDTNEMEHVFINLMTNSLQAMPAGGRLILRTTTRKLTECKPGVGMRTTDFFKPGDSAVVCEIQDAGIGIPEDQIKKVFEPFFTTKPPGEGTGLGMSIVQSIIQSHRGFIGISSREGKGTTVTITLPLANRETSEHSPSKSSRKNLQ